MNQLRKIRKNKDIAEQKIKKAKSSILKLSIIMLNFIFATFAWFTYTKILNPAVDVDVSTWKIDFKDNTESLNNAMQFEINNFYPGMEDSSKELTIENLGERPANITYEVTQLKILGQEYQIKEGTGNEQYTVYKSVEPVYKKDESGNVILDGNGNQIVEEYIIKLLNDSNTYPFEIILKHVAQMDVPHPDYPEQNIGRFEMRFTWPYEITELPEVLPSDMPEDMSNEEKLKELNLRKTQLDTQWGIDIAEYYKNQNADNDEQIIEITLQVIVKQII